MIDETNAMDHFTKVGDDVQGLALDLYALARLYAEVSCFRTYVKARHPDVHQEAMLFVEEHIMQNGGVTNDQSLQA